MIPIIILEPGADTTALPDICYVVGGDGLFLHKRNRYYSITKKIEGINFLQSLSENLELSIPRLPWSILQEVEAFFRDVYGKYKSEAIVLLYLNLDTKDWVYLVPGQTVSRGRLSVDYEISDTFRQNIPSGYELFGSIHSHANAGAFHSHTDDIDEANLDGLHITVGRLNTEPADYSCRLMISGKEYTAKLTDVVDVPKAEYDKRLLELVQEEKDERFMDTVYPYELEEYSLFPDLD